MNWRDTRGHMMDRDGWVVFGVVGLVATVVGFLIWEVTMQLPNGNLEAVQHEPGWQIIPIVIVMCVIAVWIISVPKSFTPEKNDD